MPTIAELFAEAAAERPEGIFLSLPRAAALAYAPDGLSLSYAEVQHSAEGLARDYAAAGYGKGHVVALALDNRPEFLSHFLALNALGVAILPVNPDLGAEELAHQFGIAAPDLAIALPERMAPILSAGMAAGSVIGPQDALPKAPASRGDLPDDAAALLFTSGTTGKPKCCVLSNRYFIKLAQWYVDQGPGAAMHPGEEIILTPLPLFHMNALGCSTLGAVLLRATLVSVDRFSASRWWACVAESRATVVHYLGVMPAILLKLPEGPQDCAHAIRFGFGAGVDPRHQQIFEARFGFPLIEAWAMTETGAGAVTTTAAGDRHIGRRCIGYPAPGMEMLLVGDDGLPVPDGEPGELWVRAAGPDPRDGFFSGYLGNDAATAEAWAGGWFHSGDVVRREAGGDGALFFVDRKKNIVRRSGENIAVVEVEGVLQSLDGIAAVAVAPVPDDIRGEEVMALVIPAPGEVAGEGLARRIFGESAGQLAYHKLPGHIAFVDALPTTGTQKLQRAELRRLANARLGQPATVDLTADKAALRRERQKG